MKTITTIATVFVSSVFSILASSCVNVRQAEISPTPSNIPATPSIVSEFVPTEVQETSTHLEMNAICPPNRFIPLADLGLPVQFNLVTLQPTLERHGSYEAGYFLLSSPTSDVRQIDVEPPIGMTNYNYEISPDNQWITFTRRSKTNLDDNALWITSLDGNKQWEVEKLNDKYRYGRWISASELVIIGPQTNDQIDPSQSSLPFQYYMPLAVINPFTLDKEILSSLPNQYVDEYQEQIFTFRAETIFDVFRLMFGESYIMYSYANSSSYNIFTWLHGIDGGATRVFRKGDHFIVTVTQPDGFDISSELNLLEIEQPQEYDDVMGKIVLPTELMPLEILQLMSHSNALILYQKTESFAPIKWFTLDYVKMKFVDYCYETAWDVSTYPSPDGNFVAFSRGFPEYPDGEITILNLTTGYVSKIEGFQMVGWGSQP